MCIRDSNDKSTCDNSSPSSLGNQATNTSLEEFKDIFGRYCAKENDEWQRFYGTNFQENSKLMCDTPPLHVFPKIGFEARKSLQKIKKPRTTHLKDFLRYIFMKYYSQGLNKPHFRLPCQIHKDFTWWGACLSFWQLECSHNAVFESAIVQPLLSCRQ